MNKFVTGLVACLLLSASGLSFAADTSTQNVTVANKNATSTRVGVIDMRQVMERSAQIAQIRDKLQKDFKPKQEKLLAAQNTFKADTERLRRDNAIMNNNDRKQLEQKIINEQQELQKMQTNFQQELVAAQNKELKGFLDSVKVVVEKIAKNDNLSLIITKDTVAFVMPDLDVTNKVIQQIPHK